MLRDRVKFEVGLFTPSQTDATKLVIARVLFSTADSSFLHSDLSVLESPQSQISSSGGIRRRRQQREEFADISASTGKCIVRYPQVRRRCTRMRRLEAYEWFSHSQRTSLIQVKKLHSSFITSSLNRVQTSSASLSVLKSSFSFKIDIPLGLPLSLLRPASPRLSFGPRLLNDSST